MSAAGGSYKYYKQVKISNLQGSFVNNPAGPTAPTNTLETGVGKPLQFKSRYSDPVKLPKDAFVALLNFSYQRSTDALVIGDNHCILEIPELALKNSLVCYGNNGLTPAGSHIGEFQFDTASASKKPQIKLSRTSEYFFPLMNLKEIEISQLTCRLLNSRGANAIPNKHLSALRVEELDSANWFPPTFVGAADMVSGVYDVDTTTVGAGTGCRLRVTIYDADATIEPVFEVLDGGTGYSIGDYLEIATNDLGGLIGNVATPLEVPVLTVGPGARMSSYIALDEEIQCSLIFASDNPFPSM